MKFWAKPRGTVRLALGSRSRPPSPSVSEQALLELSRRGHVPLSGRRVDADGPLRIAAVIPSFRRGSGGHATIVHLLRDLAVRGHSISLWLEDCDSRHSDQRPATVACQFAEFFGAAELELHVGFAAWSGADVTMATGWQTVPRVLLLPDTAARVYLVQDHEPDFYGASAQALFAASTYKQGLHCIAASPWLAELLHARYGASVSFFDLAADHAVYRTADEPRRDDLVVFYARTATARRAVPLGMLALQELARRRPAVEIATFGDVDSPRAAFPRTELGIMTAGSLAGLYRRATVGIVFSLTNPSLVGLEMMACGLPCVELASEANVTTFGVEGPLKLCEPDPVRLCLAVEALLDDPADRERRRRAGLREMSERTWDTAGAQVEVALRTVLLGA